MSVETSLRSWLEDLQARISALLDLLDLESQNQDTRDRLASAEYSLSQLERMYEKATEKIHTLEVEIERLKAPPSAPSPDNKPSEPFPVPSHPAPPVPLNPAHTVEFTVKNTLSQTRHAGEYVSVSVPLPASWGIVSTANLAVSVAGIPGTGKLAGTLIPADIRPVAYWSTELNPDAFQCVIVEFALPGELPPSGSQVFELLIGVPSGTNPKPLHPLSVEWDGSEADGTLLIDTGALSLGVDYLGPYSTSDSPLSGSILARRHIGPSGLMSSLEDKDVYQPPASARSVTIEYAGPLVAHVLVTGYTGHAFGPGPYNHVTFTRRYTFRAGSSLVLCRESIQWEGSWNGLAPRTSHRGSDELNAIKGSLWRERFTLSSPCKKIALFEVSDEGTWTHETSEARIEQKLRYSRLIQAATKELRANPRTAFSLLGDDDDPASRYDFEKATGGILAVTTDQGTVTACIAHMSDMEPCAISVRDRTISLDLASDSFFLAHHQGLYQTYALDIRDTSQPAPDLLAIWAQVSHPLIGLCEVSHYNTSRVYSTLPDFGDSDTEIFKLEYRYDSCLESVCISTLTKRDQEGLWGLSTWGLYPSYWGEWGPGTGQLGYNPSNPSGPVGVSGPHEAYEHGAWTDFWNCTRLSWDAAVRLARPDLLHSLLFPAALRMLHTQILQGDPSDRLSYLGGAPMGYGAYRSDFNSSHQYWETLFQYYYLTGDRSVPTTIERAVKYECERMLSDPKLSMSGRAPGQWVAAARFLSHVSTSGYDWRRVYVSLILEQIRRHYLPIGTVKGLPQALWTEQPLEPSKPNRTQQTWTTGMMDMEGLWWLAQQETESPDDRHLAEQVILQCARAMMNLGSSLAGNKSIRAKGPWVRIFDIAPSTEKTWPLPSSGVIDGQPLLFPDDIPAMCAWMSRAAYLATLDPDSNPDAPAFRSLSRDLVSYAFARILGRDLPMNKLTGLICARLSAAVYMEQEIEKLMTRTAKPSTGEAL